MSKNIGRPNCQTNLTFPNCVELPQIISVTVSAVLPVLKGDLRVSSVK
jgi:hypothetical protein